MKDIKNINTVSKTVSKDCKKLELDKILSLLANEAYSDVCRERIMNISPSDDRGEIARELDKIADAFRFSTKLGTPRFSNIKNPYHSLKRAVQGGNLSLRELLDIAAVLREINILNEWGNQIKEENALEYIFKQLYPNKSLLDRIDNAIISEEEVSDNASETLFKIRRGLERQGALIRQRLDKLTKSNDKKKFLQEGIVTMRDGRFVVPVKVEHKGEIPGIVHDTSGSGATLFVEPLGVVEANNEIRLLKSREADEIERIIAELSSACGEFERELITSFDTLISLELYFAKSNLGAKMKGVIPVLTDEPIIDLKKARHPLIPEDKVVPISISVGEGYKNLVVTGPNTGGKTVAIKTAGLFALMTRCGMMIPAADGSRIGIFPDIFVDIGDEQSIEQSLSTFSSHMNNIVRIISEIEERNNKSEYNYDFTPLVLLDELGSGTDPSEGGALAVAILDFLREKGCIVIATTHYQEVKMYAIETPDVENAYCEFDVSTLRPTYNLIIGAPGKSNALLISSRLGLGDEIIKKAENLVDNEAKRFEQTISALEKSRREVEELKEKIRISERKASEITARLENEERTISAFKEKEMENARQRALSIIESVRFSADEIIDELEDLKRSKDKDDFSQKVRGMRSRVNSSLNRLYDEANPVEQNALSRDKNIISNKPIKIYDEVVVIDINKKGTVISKPDSKGGCLVQTGIVKMKTNVKNLKPCDDNKDERVLLNGKSFTKNKNKGDHSFKVDRASGSDGGGRTSSLEVDIRGMSSDEGVIKVDSFIDDSIMNHIGSVTIIHGKGSGVLRQAVGDYLRRHKQVKEFRLGKYGEGEDGVTIVTL